jgi:hypothetical protein
MKRAGSKNRRNRSTYHFRDERIRELLAVPLSRRLRWLEHMNRFLSKAMTPEAKRIRELFRQGKL